MILRGPREMTAEGRCFASLIYIIIPLSVKFTRNNGTKTQKIRRDAAR